MSPEEVYRRVLSWQAGIARAQQRPSRRGRSTFSTATLVAPSSETIGDDQARVGGGVTITTQSAWVTEFSGPFATPGPLGSVPWDEAFEFAGPPNGSPCSTSMLFDVDPRTDYLHGGFDIDGPPFQFNFTAGDTLLGLTANLYISSYEQDGGVVAPHGTIHVALADSGDNVVGVEKHLNLNTLLGAGFASIQAVAIGGPADLWGLTAGEMKTFLETTCGSGGGVRIWVANGAFNGRHFIDLDACQFVARVQQG